jgi:ABC-type Fe3+-siderophore transport system permease subunit
MSEQSYATPDKRNDMKSKFMASVRYAAIVAAVLGILLFKQATLALEGVVVIAAVFAILFSVLYMSREEIKGVLKVLLIVAAVAISYIVFGAMRF